MIEFTKMQGLGNDFVIIDQRIDGTIQLTEGQIAKIANRNFGVGCDQLIMLRDTALADIEMVIFNADGSPAGACGNATRCVAKLIGLPVINIFVAGRILSAYLQENGDIMVNMGTAVIEGNALGGTLVNMGNSHLVIFLPQIPTGYANQQGAEIEKNFAEGINVNFAQVVADNKIVLEVWERGVGRTLACGSGACATFAAARKAGLVGQEVDVHLPGGVLHISENAQGICMAGAASKVFTGILSDIFA